MASSSAMTTRMVTGARSSRFDVPSGAELIEQLVLAAFELGDPGDELGAMRGLRVGMALSITVVSLSQLVLGDERAYTSVVGIIVEVRQLLVEHAHLVAKGP